MPTTVPEPARQRLEYCGFCVDGRQGIRKHERAGPDSLNVGAAESSEQWTEANPSLPRIALDVCGNVLALNDQRPFRDPSAIGPDIC